MKTPSMTTNLNLILNDDKIFRRLSKDTKTSFNITLTTSWDKPHLIFEELDSSTACYYSNIKLDDQIEFFFENTNDDNSPLQSHPDIAYNEFIRPIQLMAYEYYKSLIENNLDTNNNYFDKSLGLKIFINDRCFNLPFSQNLDIILNMYQHQGNFILGLSSKNCDRSKHKVWLDRFPITEKDKVTITMQKLTKETPCQFESDIGSIDLEVVKKDIKHLEIELNI